MKMKFENTTNGYVEEVDGAWFYALIFGCFYFAYKGAWIPAVFSLLASVASFGISWFILPFFADGILRKSYLQRGWVENHHSSGGGSEKMPPKRSAEHERKLAEVKRKMGWD